MSKQFDFPTEFVTVADYEKVAHKKIAKNALDYYKSGAGDELTLRLNSSAFDRIRIRPRFLRDVSTRSMACNVLGLSLSMPIGVAATAFQKMAHPDGERANARAAANADAIFVLSTIATTSIEQIAKATPNSQKWFQLYIYKDREITKQLIRRVEACNFKAIVLTVDTPVSGIRRADVRNKFNLPKNLSLANFTQEAATGVESSEGSGFSDYVAKLFDPSLTWEDVKWLMGFTKLPVILKGILTREDAKIAANLGVAGIIVSNHGARQLDSSPATIEALPEIAKAVGDQLTVMLDGGVRQGTDVFKALALGAKLVFVGRPALWGLAVDGQKGVEGVLDLLRKELDNAMCIAGCRNLSEITRDLVCHENDYCKL